MINDEAKNLLFSCKRLAEIHSLEWFRAIKEAIMNDDNSKFSQ